MRAAIFFLCLVLISCQKEETTGPSATSFDSTTTASSAPAEDDFSDLKEKKEEACDSKKAEDIALKVETKAVSLQGGGASDCTVK